VAEVKSSSSTSCYCDGSNRNAYTILGLESNYSNAQQGHQYKRIIVFGAHFKGLLYPRERECARQDRLLAWISRVGFVREGMIVYNFPSMVKKKFFGTPSEQSQNDGVRTKASERSPNDLYV
jgi:hypothetical protein